MELFTIDNISGTPIGLVTGSTIKTKDIVKDIGAGLKGLVGGKLGSYEKLMEEARSEAIEKMISIKRKLLAWVLGNPMCVSTQTQS